MESFIRPSSLSVCVFTGLQRQGSSMMEVQPSEPLLVAFGVEEEKDDDEESALEEEMVCVYK